MKLHQFSHQDFRKFVRLVSEWLDVLGITEWHIQFKHEQIGNGTAAQVEFDNEGKQATFSLTKHIEGGSDLLTDVYKLALHETLHLLLADFAWCAAKARDRDEIVLSHEHEIINRLMRVIG